MNLQGVIAGLRSPPLATRVTQSVDELQAVITDIRRTIFNLQRPPAAPPGFAQRIHDVVARLTDDRDVITTLSTDTAAPVITGVRRPRRKQRR